MNSEILSIIVAFAFSLYVGTGVMFLMECPETFGMGPIKRFIFTPIAVLIIPAIEIVMWVIEE